MILKKVRCVLTNYGLTGVALALYVVVINIAAMGGAAAWCSSLVVLHILVGLFKIALRNRPLRFGLYNLAAEILTLISASLISVFFVRSIVSDRSFSSPDSQIGRMESIQRFGWTMEIVLILVPVGLLAWGSWAAATSFPEEPPMD